MSHATTQDDAYADSIANTGALIGVARVMLLALPPADVLATCVHAMRLLGEMQPPPEGFKPLVARIRDVCKEIVDSLGDAANIMPTEEGDWSLDFIEAYARCGLGAPSKTLVVVEVCLNYIARGEAMFVKTSRDVGGQRLAASENDLLIMLPAPIVAPQDVVELAAHVHQGIVENITPFVAAMNAQRARGQA